MAGYLDVRPYLFACFHNVNSGIFNQIVLPYRLNFTAILGCMGITNSVFQ